MAGRPRLYANAAEKTRAYRERQEQQKVTRDRATLEYLEEVLHRLRQTVYAAQERGDPLALSLDTITWTDLLEDLALYFESGTICPRTIRVQPGKKVK
jgi:hypothetical protein